MALRSRGVLTVLTVALLTLAAPASADGPVFGIVNAVQPEAGLVIAGQPTAKQLKEAAKAGFHSVIDLRAAGEDRGFDEEKAARKADLAYSNIQVTPDTLNQSKVLYFLMVLREAERPVLLHCHTGDRAGALYYSWLVLEKNVPEAQAIEQARAAGLSSPELGEQIQAIVAGIKASQRPK